MIPRVWHLVDKEKPSASRSQSCLLCGYRVGIYDSYVLLVQTIDFELQYHKMLDEFCVDKEAICAFFVVHE